MNDDGPKIIGYLIDGTPVFDKRVISGSDSKAVVWLVGIFFTAGIIAAIVNLFIGG